MLNLSGPALLKTARSITTTNVDILGAFGAVLLVWLIGLPHTLSAGLTEVAPQI